MSAFAGKDLTGINCFLTNIRFEETEKGTDDTAGMTRRTEIGGCTKNDNHPKEDWQPSFELGQTKHGVGENREVAANAIQFDCHFAVSLASSYVFYEMFTA
jgi:hypothetical protein